MARRYGVWAGNPVGFPEDKDRCIEAVYGGDYILYQCRRKRGHGEDGLRCKQHAKKPEVRMRRKRA
jgi:hypothetical protein